MFLGFQMKKNISDAIGECYILFIFRAVRRDKSRDTLVVFTSDNGAALVSKVNI